MFSFNAFEDAVDTGCANASGARDQQSQEELPAVETPLIRTRSADSALAEKSSQKSPSQSLERDWSNSQKGSGAPAPVLNIQTLKTNYIRLQRTLVDLKTAEKAKEVLLRSTREELRNARETLNDTFAEYSSLRDEMKTIKQTMSREHQAVVYRKDIELFALRKGNEQKEKYIKEHDAKLDEVFQQQKATLELKDAQLKMLKERLAYMDRQASPRFQHEHEDPDGDQAVAVRVLKIKRGRSPSTDREKDELISKLEEQLTVARKAADEVVSQQGELQRAWEIAKKIQTSLREERERHAQTQEQLEEMSVKLAEEVETRKRSSSISRLPTIEEDKNELEAMFDTAQEDNLRLYAEVEALEKRLREANSRMFMAEQEVKAVKEEMQVEKAINRELESARPSVVHRVHFQRMEGQLKESKDLIAVKNEEIEALKRTLTTKEDYISDLKAEVDAAVSFHTQDQDEIERLRQSITELQTTKEQLMRDHERLATQRTRQRISNVDRTSARSSGATLIQELSPPLTRSSEEQTTVETLPQLPTLLETDRNNSIQETPKRHIRNDSNLNRWSLMTNDAPPAELRHTRRKSLGLKDLMKRIVKKEGKVEVPPVRTALEVNDIERPMTTTKEPERPATRATLGEKDRNAKIRPKSMHVASKKFETGDIPFPPPVPQRTSSTTPSNSRLQPVRVNTPRYYATEMLNDESRPQTSAGDLTSSIKDSAKSSKRKSWGTSNKLKRRSLY